MGKSVEEESQAKARNDTYCRTATPPEKEQ
jgi:hypothetical protein